MIKKKKNYDGYSILVENGINQYCTSTFWWWKSDVENLSRGHVFKFPYKSESDFMIIWRVTEVSPYDYFSSTFKITN